MGNSTSFKKGQKPPTGRPFARGYDPRRELAKLKSGRKPDEFKEMCRQLASRDETLAAVMRILEDPDHPHYFAALRWASEQGYGKPAQPITGDPASPVTVRVIREPYKPPVPDGE